MKIAFVNQPIGRIGLPTGDQPFRADSIGLWIYHVAQRCAKEHEVVVLSRGSSAPDRMERTLDGVRYVVLPDSGDEREQAWSNRGRRALGRLGFRTRVSQPYYLSPRFYRRYARDVSHEAHKAKCDYIHVMNFSQLIPAVREQNSSADLTLHMHCEWLNQLDRDTLAPRLEPCRFIFGCSQFIVERMQNRFPEYAAKCFALLNGVDTSLFEPQPSAEKTGDDLEIVYVGRISPEKGVHVLLEAFNIVAQRFRHVRLRLIGASRPAPLEYIVAIDPDPLVRPMDRFYQNGDPHSYRRHLDRIPVPEARDRIEYVGDLPQAHLLSAYQRATVFVFPSVWNEPFGMPLVEAMACGRPVVGTCSGGIPEFVRDGENGLLVSRGDAAELAEALIRLLEDEPLRRRMGPAGRAFVQTNLSWEQVARRFLQTVTDKAERIEKNAS